MRPRFRTVFWIAAAVVVAVLLALAFRPRPVPVETAEAVVGPLRVTVRDEGRTRVREEYVVAAPVAGRLLRVALEPGDAVTAGQPVARLRPSAPEMLDARREAELEAAVGAARAAAAAAADELARARTEASFARTQAGRAAELHRHGLISDQELERARLDLEVAESAAATAADAVEVRRAELAAAEVRRRQTGSLGPERDEVEVLAPVSGVVLRVAQESETPVAAGSEVMAIGDPADLEVVVELLSTEAVAVAPGAAVLVEEWAAGAPPLEGRVRRIEPAGFEKVSALGVEEQRVNVIVEIETPAAVWAGLGHDYRVEAAIVTWQAADVLQVPVAALFRRGGGWAVFRVEGGRAEIVPVAVGRDDGRNAQVLDGLAPGDRVVVYPGEELTHGAAVETRQEE